MCSDDSGKVGEKQFRANLSHEEGKKKKKQNSIYYFALICVFLILESAAFAYSTAVFFPV